MGKEQDGSVTGAVELEPPRDGIAILRLNRPDRLNAINEVLADGLRAACRRIASDDEVRVVVLTGAGRGFCAGIDLKGFSLDVPDADAPARERLRFQEMMATLPEELRELPQPVIAAVNGPAVGGGLAFVLAADIRICSRSAQFANAAIKLGLSGAEMGMSYHLPRIVGTSVAADWMLTGRTVLPDEALRCGLVSAVVDDDQLLSHALELGGQVAAHSPLGVQMTKRAIQVNTDAPSLAAAVEIENRNQVLSYSTAEAAAAREQWAQRSR